jgi:lactate permease
MSQLQIAISFLPIVVLLVLSLWRGVRVGVFVGASVTAVLFFLAGHALSTFAAVLFSAMIGTLNILMIIFGAVFLYDVMAQKGLIDEIGASLDAIHPDRNFRFYFLAFFFTAFFESVAGFGTPGAIVPLLLIAMGYDAVISIAVVLLIDGFFAMSGAIGTPVTAAFEGALAVEKGSIKAIYQNAAIIIAAAGTIVMFFIQRFVNQSSGDSDSKPGWILFAAIMVPFVGLAGFTRELTGVVASVVMAVVAFLLLFKNRKLTWKPWAPYWLLIGLLLLPKLFPWFADLLSFKIEFDALMGTDVSASMQPFRSPLIPFLAAAVFALYRVNDFTIDIRPVVTRTYTVFVVLFPSLVITQLMLVKGSETPSMVEGITAVFVTTGNLYPVVSPLLGVIGTFISGSTTVSNLIFGSAQLTAAQSLDVNAEVILALQLAGASLGNSVCLFNIIAAAAVAGVKDYKRILTLNLLPVAAACVIASVIGYLLLR